MYNRNPWTHAIPPGWNSMDSAPRDGTIIEIQNNWGIAPHFDLFKWGHSMSKDGGWVKAGDPNCGCAHVDGLHMSWRPTTQTVENYRDPTGGAQETSDYWIMAAGLNPRDYPNRPL